MALPYHHHEMGFCVTLIHRTAKYKTISTFPDKLSPPCELRQEFPSILQFKDWLNTAVEFCTYDSLLQGLGNLKSMVECKQVHARILINGFNEDVFLGTRLVSIYANYGNLADARLVFDKIPIPKCNALLWNTMIRGYVNNGLCDEALILYNEMHRVGVQPDKFTFPCVLKACAEVSALQQGAEIHDYIIGSVYESDVFVGNGLINMYAKCGKIKVARHVFDKMSQRNMVTWNAMISGYTQNGDCDEALELFRHMQMGDVKPNSVTITIVLPVLAKLGALHLGKEVHDYVIRRGFEADVFVTNALVDMYAKCGNIENAHLVFDRMSQRDVVSWNAMIACYVQNGYWNEALILFHRMEQTGMKPDSVTVVSVLPACAHLADLQIGKKIHEYIARSGLESRVAVSNALMDMYSKCGSIQFARHMFDKMSPRDAVSWNVIIAGYAHNGYCDEALHLFHQMEWAGVAPDSVTLSTILPMCSRMGALQQGKEIHNYVVRNGIESDVCVGNALIDMYAKCGSLNFARHVFNKMPQKDLVSWSAMIAGYGMYGHGEDALTLFCQMEQVGTKPDHIVFIAVLSACSHAGLVDEGWLYFDRMRRHYHIIPAVDHYACMVDLLGRAGRLDEAHDLIETLPLEPDAGVLGALLGACRIHRNIELGERVAERLFELEPENVGYYVLLSNIYAAVGRLDGVAKIRTMMKERGLKKWPGCSWIEVKNKVHSFLAGDTLHPQSEKIYSKLASLVEQMKEAGYVADTNFALHDLD